MSEENDIKEPKSEKYDKKVLQRLWKLDYEQLVMAPAEPDIGGLKEARWVLQARVALETRSMIKSTARLAWATFLLVVATVGVVVATVADKLHWFG